MVVMVVNFVGRFRQEQASDNIKSGYVLSLAGVTMAFLALASPNCLLLSSGT